MTDEKKDFGFHFDNSYARLPKEFFVHQPPTPVRSPNIIFWNNPLATSLGLNSALLQKQGGANFFSGNTIPPGARPIAQAYAGHQYGQFNILGDGRAILLGEQMTPNGERFDLQLKGSGPTPFSRGNDGRATLGSMLREYIMSEAMHALGIPTTRSLAVTTTGEYVDRESPTHGAVLTRVASSHIRAGTFEYVAVKCDPSQLKILADYTIKRHFPDLLNHANPYLDFLFNVVERQAALIARWQLIGFVHGVMNTDNMAISGETIDYGPCAFMNSYNPDTVFSSIDKKGRYSFKNQPTVAIWNLSRFGEVILPLLHPDSEKGLIIAQEAMESFSTKFQRYWLAGMRGKLGLFSEENEDFYLIDDLLKWMKENNTDYINTFRALSSQNVSKDMFTKSESFVPWHKRWKERLKRQKESEDMSKNLMRHVHPAVIPRNHLVEEAIQAAVERSDYTVMQNLLDALQNPYDETKRNPKYTQTPLPSETPYKTFCGT